MFQSGKVVRLERAQITLSTIALLLRTTWRLISAIERRCFQRVQRIEIVCSFQSVLSASADIVACLHG